VAHFSCQFFSYIFSPSLSLSLHLKNYLSKKQTYFLLKASFTWYVQPIKEFSAEILFRFDLNAADFAARAALRNVAATRE
jgi:hypothetical protein